MQLSKLYSMLLAGAIILSGCGGGGGGGSSAGGTTNNAPVADAQSVTVTLNTATAVTLTGSDADNDTLTYIVVTTPTDGTLSGTAPNLTYTPDNNYNGTDSFTFKVNDGTVDSTTQTVTLYVGQVQTVKISGNVTYDLVPANSNSIGLDYNNITAAKAKWVLVEAIDSSNSVVDSTATDTNGDYTLSAVPASTNVKIRVSSKMVKTGTPNWDVKVVDNTNSNALYVMEGALSSSGSSDSTRNLHAASGWGGTSYTSTRVAAPFAIMDDIYQSMQMVLGADAQTSFPALVVNWSKNNVAASGDKTLGEIETSHYTNANLYILGDEDSDTDEYDDHVIAHEWGHYYEDKFSRTDSLGGLHNGADHLDIRVAFGEGFGNAVSGMALQDPTYFDTLGQDQSNGWSMNLESATAINPGWFNESSIQRILFDLYDSDDDGSDSLSLGFTPLHNVFVGAQKNTEAFTSIFSFITELKSANGANSTAIDAIVSSESIATIADIYGTGRTNTPSQYPYNDLTVGSSVNVCTSNVYGSYNKLGNRRYVKFTIGSQGNYTIKVQQTNAPTSDPDFYLFKTSPFAMQAYSDGIAAGVEEKDIALSSGNYLLDISEYNNLTNACFDVTVNP